MSSSRLFYVHALVVMCFIIALMTPLGPMMRMEPDHFVPPLLLVTVLFPIVICVVAVSEKQALRRVAAVVALSAVLTVASFYAVLPMAW